MPGSMQAGDVLDGRYRLDDLLAESHGGRFWRAHDLVLHRPVAVHLISADDERAEAVLDAARSMGPLADRRVLRVLDADRTDSVCFVVVEWGQGESLDILLQREGPLPPRRAAWLVSEVADSIAGAHALGLSHGRLVPENVLIDHHGHVRLIGFAIESALAGLPSGRASTDRTDLVGLLYAALTGKWPGVSRSALRAAPVEHGHVLRPRRVRAGIPRQLDELCDEVLNDTAPRHRGPHDLTTARGIADLLQEFVGDASGLGAMTPGPPTVTIPVGPMAALPDPALPDPALPDPALPDPSPPPVAPELAGVDAGSEADTDADLPPTDLPPPPGPPASDDLATEAGMPVFHDDSGDVEWLRARSEPPAPPPPLEDAPVRPLFAPDPPQGEPVRRPRAGSAAAAATGTDSGFWPWGSDTGTGTGTGSTGSGSWTGDSWGSNAWDTSTGEHVPGRSWFRLALVVGLGALVLLAAVAAYQLGLGNGTDDATPDGPTGGDNPSAAAPTPFTDLQASDFDPQGSPPRDEYPELVPLAIDGDPGTSWNTATYKQNFGPGGLKTGVGIVVDLGEVRDVREVAVTVEGSSTVAAYVTETAPTGVAGLTPVGEATGDGDLTITLDEAVPGQYVTVWLTAIPRVDGGFRGTIAEIQVRG